MVKALHWAATIGAVCAAAGFLRAHLPWLAGLEAVCAAGLAIGPALKTVRVTRVAQLLLLLQTVIVGAIWPSAVTVAALLVVPAAFLVVRDVFKDTAPQDRLLYVQGSALLAAWSLAAEGWVLAAFHGI